MKLIAFTICLLVGITGIGSIAIDIKALVACGKVGWDLFNEVFYSNDSEQKPTELEVRYINDKGQQKQTYIHYDSKVDDASIQSKGPFQSMQETAGKLIRNKKITPFEDCDFVYYKKRYGKRRRMSIIDDETLIQLMSEKGDHDDGHTRLIDINCEQVPVPPPVEQPTEAPVPLSRDQIKLFKKNEKAFNHVIAVQNDKAEEQQNIADKVLKEAGIGGFNIKAKGVAILSIDKNEFEARTKVLAEAFGWDEKIKSVLGIVLYAGKSFSAGQDVVFDPTTWTISGTYARFAAFKDNNDDTYSLYVATADFTYKVPKGAKSGGLLDYLGITDGGSIKGEYVEQIRILMEGRALHKFKIDVNKPDLDDFNE